jgi:hypothetical protein
MVRLTVEASPDGSLDVSGVLGDCFLQENQHQRIGSNVQTLSAPVLVFRALLAQDGAHHLELARA